jgi:hypothetical protein
MVKKSLRRDEKKVLRVPIRGLPSQVVVYEFPSLKGKVEGGSFKLYLRDQLKRVPEYHRIVELDFKVEGRSSDGVPIPVSTVGRWLFGVPGYAGNARFVAMPGRVPYVEVWCGGCDEEVVKVLDRLFAYVGGKRVRN